MDGCMHPCIGPWKNRQTDKQIDQIRLDQIRLDRQTGRQTGKQADRQVVRQDKTRQDKKG